MAPGRPDARDSPPPNPLKPKVYRSPVQTVTGSVLAGVLIVAGVVLIGTIRQGGATVVVAGLGAVIIGAAIEVAVRGSYLSVAPEGVTCAYNFRRQTTRWRDIKDFEIVPTSGQGMAAWALALRLPGGPVKIRAVAGTHEYLEQVVADLRSFQKSYGQQAGASG